ncbi:uncharacterized protein LOC113331792 [Papaver somniferum]|uniref:uncharacterized protein LOC113331792 n=1 Tax=Papaver somniferum TaxID=3469 RepID=UPI000E6F8947|nr:uncharacterized protein LOC113331792 [Papaver somniferum]
MITMEMNHTDVLRSSSNQLVEGDVEMRDGVLDTHALENLNQGIHGRTANMACKTVSGLAKSAEETESLAILEATNWAINKDIAEVCIYSDAMLSISYLMNKTNQTSWLSRSILDDCLHLSNNFSFFRVQHVKSEKAGV